MDEQQDVTAGLVVVGGGPAGLEAARAFRDRGGRGRVVIVSADEHAPYNRPPLSKDFLRGESEADELPLEDPSFYADHDIELVLETRVTGLDADAHEATLADGSRLSYSTLVLATGSAPSVLPVDGADHPDLHVLRSRTHAHRLRDAGVGTAVVVGSGFIGCEAAVSLAVRGVEVTVVSMEESPQHDRLGPEVAARITGWLEQAGVRFVGGGSVASIEDGHVVHLEDGSSWTGDLVLVAGGITPHSDLAEQAGLATSEGRVVVDDRMRTSAPAILAAGDVVLADNGAAGRALAVEHWGEALRMGEIAGATAAGDDERWAEVPGFWSEIGEHTLKYAAWGDGHDAVRFVDHGDGAFTAWYGRDGVLVGVLTHESDDDYERGESLVASGASLEAALA